VNLRAYVTFTDILLFFLVTQMAQLARVLARVLGISQEIITHDGGVFISSHT
jgi:hypothetical protein